MENLTIRWQRLVDEHGQTCHRCGATEQAVDRAAANLRQALQALGIEVRLEKSALSSADFSQAPLESNRLWIGDAPLEHWLDATAGASLCCSTCGGASCRTLKVADETYEAVPVELIIQAGLLAAARLLGRTPTGCCLPAEPSAKGGCCGEHC